MMPVKTKLIKDGIGISIHIIVWVAVAYIFNQAFRTEFRKFTNIGKTVTESIEIHTFQSFIVIVLTFKAVFFYLNVFYRRKILFGFQDKVKYVLFSCFAILILIVAEWLVILVAGKLYQISMPPFGLFIWPEVLMWVIAITISFAWAKMREWDKAEELSKILAEEQLKTELNFLKAQISPHFFLNTLNNLYSMGQANDISGLGDGILQLSEMMRYVLYDCQADTVPIQREIECIRSYIGLTLLRYRQDGNIIVHFNADEKGLAGKTIAPVILLPFVENAFKHGIASDKSSSIEIELFTENSQLICKVRNTDHSAAQQHFEERGIGFNNVKRRLEMLYPEKHVLEIKKENGFYTILLKLTGNEMRYN
jgi:two-component system LytT family sensor kinase